MSSIFGELAADATQGESSSSSAASAGSAPAVAMVMARARASGRPRARRARDEDRDEERMNDLRITLEIQRSFFDIIMLFYFEKSWSSRRARLQSDGSRSKPRTGGQPTGPFFSNAKTVSSGTTVHRDLTHVARSCEHGAEARGRPDMGVRLMFLCVHSVTNFSRNKTNIIKIKV